MATAKDSFRWTLVAVLSALSVCAIASTLGEKSPPSEKPAPTKSLKLAP